MRSAGGGRAVKRGSVWRCRYATSGFILKGVAIEGVARETFSIGGWWACSYDLDEGAW